MGGQWNGSARPPLSAVVILNSSPPDSMEVTDADGGGVQLTVSQLPFGLGRKCRWRGNFP
jgi:hypothetical protein